MGATLGGLDSMMRSYLHWNGRFGELLKVWFGSYFAHKPYFAFVNALFGVGLLYLLFALLFGRVPACTLSDCAILALMLAMFMIFRAFGAIFFWAAGSLNYLWAWCLILLWLLPYRIFWQRTLAMPKLEVDSRTHSFIILKALGMFMLGIVAGWSSELGIVVGVFQVGMVVFGIFTKTRLPLWYYAGIAGFFVGWGILYASPGHRERAHKFFAASGAYISLSDFLAMSLGEKFARWQKVFGNRSWYGAQSLVMAIIWCMGIYAYASYTRIVKLLLMVVGVGLLIVIAHIYPARFGFLVTPLGILCMLFLSVYFVRRHLAYQAWYSFVLGCLFIAYFACIAATIQVGLPGRAKIPYAMLDISIVLCMCMILKDSLKPRTISYIQKSVIVICAIYGLYVCMACVEMRLKWERMLASIDSQKAMGATEVIVNAHTFVSYYRGYMDWGNPGDNPDTWPNNVYAKVFGVEKFIAK